MVLSIFRLRTHKAKYRFCLITAIERFRDAISHLQDALSVFTSLGLTLNEAMAENCLGEAYLRMGDLDHAEEWLLAAIDSARRSPSRYEEARAMRSLGEVTLTRGDQDGAVARWQDALDIYAEISAPEAAQLSDRMSLS